MNKKVAILTFHASHNCGSMLQAYALQTALRNRYGVSADIIDYVNKGSENLYGYFDLRLKKSAVRNNIQRLSNIGAVRETRKDYIDFEKRYLHTTQKTYKKAEDLAEIDDHYDIVIAGGDQVWNVKCPDADDAYFLGFIKKAKKAAYSPSFGGNNINKVAADPKKYKDYLLDFDMLSVREPNGQKWIEELTGIHAPIIADPTLLLTKEEWLEQFPIDQIEEKFIFNYAFYHNRKELNTAIQKISEKSGMPVYTLDLKSWAFYKLDKYGIKRYRRSGPIAFIELMSQADMVLTQSFHGTLFSAMFHKHFWSYRGPVIMSKEDDRATAIMDQLGLRDRYQIIDNLPDMDFMREIDYSNTDKLICNMREKAFEYLDSFMM